ncbi:MAG: phenylacetate--CoA ligase family protein, partial [Nitrospinota bacterium]
SENIVREFGEVSEFRIEVETVREMAELRLSVELGAGAEENAVVGRLSKEIHSRLGVRAAVTVAAPGTLPRFELKARRVERRA